MTSLGAVTEIRRYPVKSMGGGVMRALVKEAGGELGTYATVEVPGTVRRGDAVTLLD